MTMKHYEKNELDLYRHGKMCLLARLACAAHLRECPECSRILDELKADDELIRELRGSVELFTEISRTIRTERPSSST